MMGIRQICHGDGWWGGGGGVICILDYWGVVIVVIDVRLVPRINKRGSSTIQKYVKVRNEYGYFVKLL